MTELSIVTPDKERAEVVVATDLSPSDVHFVPQGLAVQTVGRNGLLCAAEVFRWVDDIVDAPGRDIEEERAENEGAVSLNGTTGKVIVAA